MYSVRSDRPLDPVMHTILHHVHDACAALGVDYVLIGASARDIMLTHVFGQAIRRATRDVDVAVTVPDRPTFERIMSWLLTHRDGWSRSSTIQHRLMYHAGSDGMAAPLDIVPFGGIEDPSRRIAWPPKGTTVMNVAGFSEALRAAVSVQIAADLVVPVASIPGLAVLKVFAWSDRRLEDAKDAVGLLTLLREYADAGNLERLYADEMVGILESYAYDPVVAGAHLLGMDVVTIADTDTRSHMLALLGGMNLRSHLLQDMARSQSPATVLEDDTLSAIDALLAAFVAGLSAPA